MHGTAIANHADLGRTIRAAREARQWTQETLGYHAGVKRITVARLERGTPVNSTTLFKVLEALDLRMDLISSDAPR